ncbi:MAG TPA: hypothetical protein VLL05_09930 [Terriglobales bacterium]|nr:hypothetical protein [Terriglobales bacterium]
MSSRNGCIMTMNKTVCALLWLAMTAGLAGAQSDPQQPAPDDSQRTPPPAAYGQDNPPVVVNENPPISGLDRPSLEPNFQPRSMLVGGVEASESLDSNIGSDARPALHSVTRGLGGLTMQRLWRRYQLAAAYVGGVGYYNQAGNGLKQIQELQAQQAVLWRTGQLTVRDSFSYLPEGSFGYGSYGGSGGFQLGLGSLGEGLSGMVGSGFGGHYGFLGSQQLGSLGQAPRITNAAIVDVVQALSPRSSLTAAGSFGLVHFTDSTQGFINSRQAGGQVGYSYAISHKNQVAVSYGFQAFHFPGVEGADNVTSQVVQGMFGHRVSGRMDLVIGAGPQWTRIQDPLFGTTNRLSAAGTFTLRYQFRVTSAALSFERFDTSGSGFFAGAVSNIARLQLERRLGRRYTANASLGFSHNQRLQSSATGVAATSYNYGFAGLAVRRQFGYNWGAFLSYQWNDQVFDTCPIPGQTNCNRIAVRHVLTLGVDWHFRPIRLD